MQNIFVSRLLIKKLNHTYRYININNEIYFQIREIGQVYTILYTNIKRYK